jgi:uncharacterized protein YeaO (DUF488 family)
VTIGVKRVYAPRSGDDGYRILVDRLWPRGLRRAEAGVDLWLRDLAPSTDLRTWFGHRAERWSGFRERYRAELVRHGELLDLIRDVEQHRGSVTLLFGARDEEHNEARVLVEVLGERPAHSHR